MENDPNTLQIEFSTNIWYSVGDESSFFHWIYSLKGYKSCVGRGRTLYVDINLEEIDKASMVELVSIFRRYKIKNFAQLRVLAKAKDGDWFSDPSNFWYKAVFLGIGEEINGS